MAKTVQTKRPAAPVEEKPGKSIIPEKYQSPLFIALLFIAIYVFFWSAISAGGFNEFDNISYWSFQNYLKEAKSSGNFPQWVPYIFSGMPSFAALLVTGDRTWDFISKIYFSFTTFFRDIFNNDAARVAFFYFIYSVGLYLLLRFKKMERFTSFFAALAGVFSTWIITWIMIGHNTKPMVISMVPFVFLFLEKLRIKFSLLYTALLFIAVHLMMEGSHLQMIFYFGSAMGIYFIYELIVRAIRKEEPLKVLRPAILLIVAFGLSYIMAADRYFSVSEYTPYSTRGSAPITKVKGHVQDASGGNDYEYATMWSYSPGETFTFFNPSYFGFGTRQYQESMAPTYWGQKESEDSPPYMGIAVLALAIIGFIMYRRDPFVQFLFVLGIFAILLSFGKNMPLLYDLFYYHFPSFNKFRAPSMSLAMLHFAVPILAGYGLTGIVGWRKNFGEKEKKIAYGFMILAGAYFVIGLLFSAAFKSSYMSAVDSSNYIKQITGSYGASVADELKNFIWSNMIEDWMITGLIVVATAVLSYFFAKRKLNKTLFYTALAAILIFDLWRVDYRRMDVSKESAEESVFKQYEDLYGFIKQDKSVFRIADFAANPANIPAYYLLENINGYHAAKLRIYQDLMDVANPEQYQGSTSQIFNPFLWNLMNVKYIVSRQPFGNIPPAYKSQTGLVYYNPTMLPRAFFVKHSAVAKQMDILNHLKNGDFNPIDTAFVEQTLQQGIDIPDSTARAEVVSHKNEYVKIEAYASGNNLLFISEIYYPPSWRAYLDGKEIPIIKTNFAFRAVIVPRGQHTIEMKYHSEKFEQGKTLSLLGNIVVVLVLAAGIFIESRNRKRVTEEDNLPKE